MSLARYDSSANFLNRPASAAPPQAVETSRTIRHRFLTIGRRCVLLLVVSLLPAGILVRDMAREPRLIAAEVDQSRAEPVPAENTRPLPPLSPALAELLATATPLNPERTVFVDIAAKRLTLRTEVACRTCILEMLCVPEGFKEHETILRIRSRAYVIHAGLLALGLDPGQPAQFYPEFAPPAGTEIGITAAWLDEDGKLHRRDVRHWIRRNVHRYYSAPLAAPPAGLKLPYKELRYDKFNHELLWYGPLSETDRRDLLEKSTSPEFQAAINRFFADSQSQPMEASFVFVGSRFTADPDSGQQFYAAEGGCLICVANFTDALLDIREDSSASDGAQAYEAWTEHLPPEGTPVLLELVPIVADPEAVQAAPQTPQSASDTPRSQQPGDSAR